MCQVNEATKWNSAFVAFVIYIHVFPTTTRGHVFQPFAILLKINYSLRSAYIHSASGLCGLILVVFEVTSPHDLFIVSSNNKYNTHAAHSHHFFPYFLIKCSDLDTPTLRQNSSSLGYRLSMNHMWCSNCIFYHST